MKFFLPVLVLIINTIVGHVVVISSFTVTLTMEEFRSPEPQTLCSLHTYEYTYPCVCACCRFFHLCQPVCGWSTSLLLFGHFYVSCIYCCFTFLLNYCFSCLSVWMAGTLCCSSPILVCRGDWGELGLGPVIKHIVFFGHTAFVKCEACSHLVTFSPTLYLTYERVSECL